MKKILFVAGNPWVAWGGSEKLWVYTAKHLLATGAIQSGVLIRKWGSIEPVLGDLLKTSTVFQMRYQNWQIEHSLGRYLPHLRSSARNEHLFRELIKKFVPDLAVVSQGANYDGLDWMEICGKFKVPFVTISQAANDATWLDAQTAERLGSALLQARRNFFVCQANHRLTELLVGQRLPNSSVVANPFDVPYDARPEFPPTQPDFRLACVARFELPAKGQDVLLEALSDPKWKRRNLSIGLYGNGWDKSRIEKMIKLFGLEKTVRLMGFIRPLEIWRTNHALVLPSRYEGLPLALVEAMICGRFGIVTNVSGNAEVVEDEVSGFIAEAPKAQYFDSALERAWARRTEWEAIGQQARNFILEKVPADPVAEFSKALMSLA